MATIATLTNQTLLVTAADAGQVLYLNGAVAAISDTSGDELRVYGTGTVEASHGNWDRLLVVEGQYAGPYFTGSQGVASITDPLPPLVPVKYRARAYNTDGGWTDSDEVLVDATACDVHINYGPLLDRICRGGWDPSIQVSTGRRKAMRHYVEDPTDAESGDPAVITGPRLPYQIGATITIDESTGDTPLVDWETMSESEHPAVWRDSAGRIIHGSVDAFTADDSSAEQQTISLTFTRTRQDAQ